MNRRKFLGAMGAVFSGEGPIIVYGHFESTILKALIARFADLSEPLTRIIARIKNFLPITEDHYYHPVMMGSWSLKNVAPTISPELNYDDVGEVQHGGAAQEAFLQIISPSTTEARRDSLARALSDYCAMDTYALAKLVRFFATS